MGTGSALQLAPRHPEVGSGVTGPYRVSVSSPLLFSPATVIVSNTLWPDSMALADIQLDSRGGSPLGTSEMFSAEQGVALRREERLGLVVRRVRSVADLYAAIGAVLERRERGLLRHGRFRRETDHDPPIYRRSAMQITINWWPGSGS
jgi:hypothetical protein